VSLTLNERELEPVYACNLHLNLCSITIVQNCSLISKVIERVVKCRLIDSTVTDHLVSFGKKTPWSSQSSPVTSHCLLQAVLYWTSHTGVYFSVYYFAKCVLL